MILADKIIDLRKKNGWSQEELGEQLGVSRQAVSKWESTQTVPDLNKIIAMAEVFGVSTDYLLKDELETPERKETAETAIETGPSKRVVTMEEANAYLSAVKEASRGFGLSALLLCISPVAAAVLYAIGAGDHAPFTADSGAMFGTIIQTLILAAAVILLVWSGIRLSRFSHLKKYTFETEYGVDGMVKELMKANEHPRLLKIMISVALCFLSVIPLMACSMLAGENNLLIALGGSVMLVMIGVGLYLLIDTCVFWRGLEKLVR